MQSNFISPAVQESVELIQEIFEENGCKHLCPSEKVLIRDWGLEGGESCSELRMWVNDYISECDTEMSASKNAWRYEI